MKKRDRQQKRDAPAGPPIRPVKVSELMEWLQGLKEERPEDLDRIEETLDILADYEAAKEMETKTADVKRVNARLLICSRCGKRVIPGDVSCSSCGRRLVWNLRGGTR